jgi:hypothetical protein
VNRRESVGRTKRYQGPGSWCDTKNPIHADPWWSWLRTFFFVCRQATQPRLDGTPGIFARTTRKDEMVQDGKMRYRVSKAEIVVRNALAQERVNLED